MRREAVKVPSPAGGGSTRRGVLPLALLVLLLGGLPWVRLNLSPSVPRGLYRLHRVSATLAYGQLVLVDVPAALKPWWPRRTPLLKPVVGLLGDVLTIQAGHMYINATDYGPVRAEALGRPLPQVCSPTVIEEGEVAVATMVPGSLDSRYFGPVRRAALMAVATPLWVWE